MARSPSVPSAAENAISHARSVSGRDFGERGRPWCGNNFVVGLDRNNKILAVTPHRNLSPVLHAPSPFAQLLFYTATASKSSSNPHHPQLHFPRGPRMQIGKDVALSGDAIRHSKRRD